jgi:subtilisin family serine protease
MRLSITLTAVIAAVAAALAPAPAAAAAEGDLRRAGALAIPGSYLVVLNNSANVDRSIAHLTERHGGAVGHIYRHALKGFAVKATEAVAKSIAADPAVAYVEEDARLTITETQLNPPSWGLDRIDRNVRGYNNSYEFPTAGDGVRAYVLDTGVRITHQDFGGRASYGWDFVDNDADAGDCHGHGTHVAGTIGSTTYGVAKRVNLVSVRVANCSGDVAATNLVAGVNWVTAQGVRPAVVNVSIAFPQIEAALETAITNSIASGITYAIGAGNGDSNGNPRDACGVSPARVPNALTVGATDANDRRVSYTNFGPCVDIFAPGASIRSTWNTSDTASGVLTGTSMAAPHVAGAAAIVLGAQPTFTPAQVRDRLVNLDPTVGAIPDPGTGSPNRLLFVRSGPLKINLGCSVQTGSYACSAEAIGAVAPGPYQWSTLASSTCVITRTVNITVSVTDSLLATASNSRTFVCRARCGLQSIGVMCISDPRQPAIATAGRRPER